MINLVRRTFLFATGAAVMLPKLVLAEAPSAAPVDITAPLTGPFSVPPLGYAYEANEPAIDAQTMHLHHDKHHAAYVTNLNTVLKDHPEVAALPLHEMLAKVSTLPDAIRTVVRNNAGGHANHTMLWQVMGGKGGAPMGDVEAAITRDFTSFDKMKTEFNTAATKVFGSGWAMILVDHDGKLSLVAKPNQDSPIMDGKTVLFGNDVWEHAYYLKYQNRRAEYLNAWWNVLDWSRIGERYAAAKAGTLKI